MNQPASQETLHTRVVIASVARGSEALLLADILAGRYKPLAQAGALVHVSPSDRDMEETAEKLAFFAPETRVMRFPAWNCLPYDRSSPATGIVAQRVETLVALANRRDHEPAPVILTTINALLQRLPLPAAMREGTLLLENRQSLPRDTLVAFMIKNGYRRAERAMEQGEFALRGGIVDIVPPGWQEGIRLDFFGDEIEHIRVFDPMSQLSNRTLEKVALHAVSEILLNSETIDHFRARYREQFGAVTKSNPLYEAISEGRTYPGMEHWLPLFYASLTTLDAYLPPQSIFLFDHQALQAADERHETIRDYYQARLQNQNQNTLLEAPYHPLPPEQLYLMQPEWNDYLHQQRYATLSPFAEAAPHAHVMNAQMQGVPNLAALHGKPGPALLDGLREFASHARQRGKATLIACYSQGSSERISAMLMEHGFHCIRTPHWRDTDDIKGKSIGLCVLPLEHGFETPHVALLTEQDLLGERIIRARPKKKKADNFLIEAASFMEGELVVHREHGIGRFEGLVTLEVLGAKHDCLKLIYADDDKLFLPVENIELVSRYGSEEEGAKLDKLGSASWQARTAKLKERIKLAAEELMKTAAARMVRPGAVLSTPSVLYEAFCSGFPYVETEDQAKAIDDVAEDLVSGRPMDRLICGDVGFGKTEVALRAAFLATHAPEGKMQVAVITPTTLLCRQHYRNFKKRFEGFGVTVRQLSRLESAKEQARTKDMLKDGSCDIVVGTHALLSKEISFEKLGLLVVDEEQHFGVAQKEKIKSLKTGVHVLTLSATPIPRTLQLALSGVRELSLITTPPVDRLAVRTFVMPMDDVVLKEAILREKHRGGQVFYVAPRIADLPELKVRLTAMLPEMKIAVAHGQMAAGDLDSIINDFYEAKFDLLLSTAIIESGLDIPSANTMIIHRADMFGLAQLYQMRGRVGRGKQRAYAYLTLPPSRQLTKTATRRLEVMQTLDTLGAGFSLASHDMDIRGFGNLVGEEQSGHIREVGIELYQQMLADAVEAARANSVQSAVGRGQKEAVSTVHRPPSAEWSPQINVGLSVLIPEHYVPDLNVRLGLYRRLAELDTTEDIESFAAELVDRFGKLPHETEHLIAVLHIKRICRAASIERVDTGPKGALVTFYKNSFPKPEALLRYIGNHPLRAKLRPDQKLVLNENWKDEAQKLKQLSAILAEIAALAG